MTLGLELGSVIDEIGTREFVNAIRSTIAGRLEGFRPGSIYPQMNSLLSGHVIKPEQNAALSSELATIRSGLRRFKPEKVVWDIDDDAARPPWGFNISSHITSLENYFVSSTGRDVLDIFDEALEHQREIQEPMEIVGY